MAVSDFGKAFRAARKSGKKTFTWKGKAYTTEMKGESKSPKNVPVPATKPDRSGRQSSVDKTRTKDDTQASSTYPKDKPKAAEKKQTPGMRALGNMKKALTNDRGSQAFAEASLKKVKDDKAKADAASKKKKVGPFGLGGMFKLGGGSTFK